MKRVVRRACRAALALLLATCSQTAWGGIQFSVRLPTAGTPPAVTGGLRLDVDVDWVQGNGPLPVHLKLHAAKAEPADRKISVEVAVSYRRDRDHIVVTTDLILPAGERQVEAWLPVPQVGWGQAINVRSYIGGQLVEPLSTTNLWSSNYNYGGNDASVPRMLFIADSPPDVSQLGFTLYSFQYSGLAPSSTPQGNFSQVHLTRDRLLDQWIFYAGLDYAFVSLDDAKYLATQRPKEWRALADWTRSGGVLCVSGVGLDDASLADVETVLEAPPLEHPPGSPRRGWSVPAYETLQNQVKLAIESQQAQQAAQQANAGSSGTSTFTSPSVTLTAPADPPFAWRPVDMGQVVAISSAQPFPGTESDWRWLLMSVAPTSSNWGLRYGVTPEGQNPRFNAFLIADVGLPPIGAYRVLITLLVVLIGPVNYWLLRRAGRLHLFLFTVPAAALLTSAALLAYVLLSDGLVSRLRARSYTLLDQQAGRATSAAWLSYYAGVAPSSGLTFPTDTLVIPCELDPRPMYDLSNPRHRLRWGEQQHLSQGWLPSRTPTQFVTQRNCETPIRLDFPAASGDEKSVMNRLGVRVVELVVRQTRCLVRGLGYSHRTASGACALGRRRAACPGG